MNKKEAAYRLLSITPTATSKEIHDAYQAAKKKYAQETKDPLTAKAIDRALDEAYELVTSSQNMTAPSSDENKCCFYKVVIPVNSSVSIPKICPVCGKATEEIIDRKLKFTEHIPLMPTPEDMRERKTTYTATVPFHCDCPENFDKYVKSFRNSSFLCFFLKNKEYADSFAYTNKAVSLPVSRTRYILDRVKRGFTSLTNTRLFRISVVPIACAIFILVFVVR